MTDLKVQVRATVDAWIDGWTFDETNPWSLAKFEAVLDPDAVVIDDYGGELSILNGHTDYREVWGTMVAQSMRQWKIAIEEDTMQIWADGTVAVASFALSGGGVLADGTRARLRQYCTFPMEYRDGRWLILKEHITTDPTQSS